ncbi:MaoC/PaaZ C-terminal domain-containing protein [Actinokineospora bangkokensis]|uniref:3-alpha,7-alpha, 12-alpha-trihydroxy-5-beta-cholest-24-enoyl-CoA hydratase n=1 Tax=Actinokineospora bangkokensis TaxID=1193682 RepID=A0A1Q9LH22_9PSEU|nr:MaoC/PaaZ C-terminal domain-containing protein [Actinokineospora bangkokensis]OLR91347.1 3-alpha,7-alpha,12-alpha-trihydroxy-5-beta-cholest-24-enoyl-CoA hydratase [Actinokineospora bangkokensis]
MPIDPAVAVGARLPDVVHSWDATDVLRYHLALGAGSDPFDPRELRWAYEDGLRVLPTYAALAPSLGMFEPPRLELPGVRADLAAVLHGGQSVVLAGPLPTAGRVRVERTLTRVLDKGGSAVVVVESVAHPADGGEPWWRSTSTLVVRGAGGFGGARGPKAAPWVPDRPADLVVDSATLPQQALLYRLCGDRNPLHADPAFARAAGFPAPVLHGLCTYGVVCKALVGAVLDGDSDRVTGCSARFAGVVYPGEVLRTRAWVGPGGLRAATTVPARDDAPALAEVELTWAG